MNNFPLLFVLSLIALSPLPTLALIIDTSAPLGSPNNPINVLPVKTLDQTLQEHRQNFQDLQRQQQQAERDLWQGVMNRQNQLIRQNNVQPIAPNIIVVPSGQSATQPTPSNKCPKNTSRLWEGGECLCLGHGYAWNDNKTICEFDQEQQYRDACGSRAIWDGTVEYTAKGWIDCTCAPGTKKIEGTNFPVPDYLQCPSISDLEPPKKTGFFAWLFDLFGIHSDA